MEISEPKYKLLLPPVNVLFEPNNKLSVPFSIVLFEPTIVEFVVLLEITLLLPNILLLLAL